MFIPVPLQLLFYHTRIFVNELGLHGTPPFEIDILPRMLSTGSSWYNSTGRSDSIIRCLQATKEYLDHFLRISPEAIVHFTTPDFLHLIYAILILGSIATTCHSPQLDQAHIRQIAAFENYISALSQKTMQAIATISQTGGTHGHLKNLHHLWQRSGPWYLQATSRTEMVGISIVDYPDFSFMEIFSTIIRRCANL